jgi:hypothetical protein
MTAAYPIGIRSILRAGKSRSQPAQFRLSEPRKGYAYAQRIGTDVPVFWEVSFLFTPDEAMTFQVWFAETLRGGVDEFTMPIRTEFGVITHTCRFLPDSLLPCAEQGGLFGYSAKIMARAQIIPAVYRSAASMLTTLPDWRAFGLSLDQAMTVEIPA